MAKPSPLKRLTIGFSALVIILCLAVTCYRIAGWSFMDSLYFVFITVSGVGYGEVRPLDTTGLRLLTIALIVGGLSADAVAVV